MIRLLRFLHLVGFALALGSILTFILISSLAGTPDLATLAFGRRIISTGTAFLTMPGLWLAAFTGIAGAWPAAAPARRWLLVALAAALLVNAHAMIVPAATAATRLAVAAVPAGILPDAYRAAYLRESVGGAVNVGLLLVFGFLNTRSRRPAPAIAA